MYKKIIFLCLVLMVFLTACKTEQINQPLANKKEPIKIGFVSPLSGDAAVYGEMAKNVVELARQEVNQAGGIDGRELEIIYEDGKCDGKEASLATQKLINIDQVELIIGGFCSSESLASVPIVESNQVMWFSPGSTSPDLSGISKYFARSYPDDKAQIITLARIAERKNWTKIAFVTEQNDYPMTAYKTFSDNFEGTTTNNKFESGETDFRSILTQIKSQNSDAVFVNPQTASAGNLILKQIKELAFKPALLISETILVDQPTLERNTEILEGALGATFKVGENNHKFKNLVHNYQTKYNTKLIYPSYAQTFYDSVYMVKDAIEEVGHDGEKLAEWFQDVTDWQGASGLITIRNGDRVADQILKVVRNGEVVDYVE